MILYFCFWLLRQNWFCPVFFPHRITKITKANTNWQKVYLLLSFFLYLCCPLNMKHLGEWREVERKLRSKKQTKLIILNCFGCCENCKVSMLVSSWKVKTIWIVKENFGSNCVVYVVMGTQIGVGLIDTQLPKTGEGRCYQAFLGRLEICQNIYTTKFLCVRILHIENA